MAIDNQGLVIRESKLLPSVILKALDVGRRHDTWNNTKFHLSDALDCIRKISYRVQGYPSVGGIDAESLFAFLIGSATHEAIQETLVKEGLLDKEDVEIPIEDPEVNLIGKADGVIWNDRILNFCAKHQVEVAPQDLALAEEIGRQRVLLELKTKKDGVNFKGESTFEKYTQEAEKKHIVQAQGYQYYLDLQWAWILYINKNSGGMKAFLMNRDVEIGQSIRDKAALVKQYLDSKSLPPRPYNWMDKSSEPLTGWFECYGYPSKTKKGVFAGRCSHFAECWKDRISEGKK